MKSMRFRGCVVNVEGVLGRGTGLFIRTVASGISDNNVGRGHWVSKKCHYNVLQNLESICEGPTFALRSSGVRLAASSLLRFKHLRNSKAAVVPLSWRLGV